MNCKNCGAPLNGNMICDYCGTDNSITEAKCKKYIIKMSFDGAEREFYIENIEYQRIETLEGRTLDGEIILSKPLIKRKMYLIEV